MVGWHHIRPLNDITWSTSSEINRPLLYELIDGLSFFANSAIPLSDKTEFYAFGGRNYRETDAFAFTRNNPTARNVVSIYPDGFTPRITSVITDNSISAGVLTHTEGGWTIDLNNTYGKNLFHYYIKGTLITDPKQELPVDPITNEARPGGSQGFPGYSPANEVGRSRSNLALYLDTEFDLTDAFLVSVAGRYEKYSDFGKTLNYKLAARYKVADALSIRGSLSSGFRAPSLVQIYYNLRFTDFQGGEASETLLSPNNSPVTASFGIEQLKEERALNGALGFTFSSGGFSATVDGYLINVDDRIVLTGTFDASGLGINVAEAQFFANGVDTETRGVDVVLSYRQKVGANNLLNAYPSIQTDGETETGGYWDAVQMGFSGAFYFARLGFKF